MSHEYRESLEIEKLQGETQKLSKEIEKIRTEIEVNRSIKSRFWIGTVLIPILVASVTLFTIGRTGYFNAWQTKIENAEHDYKDTVRAFANRADSLKQAEDSLTLAKDSISKAILKMSTHLSRLTEDSLSKAGIISSLTIQLHNGVTPNATVNALARKNDSLQTVVRNQIFTLGDKDEKMRYLLAQWREADHEEHILADSIANIYTRNRYFMENDFDLLQKRLGMAQSNLGIQKMINQSLQDSIGKLNKLLHK
jgi:hypothetical protein